MNELAGIVHYLAIALTVALNSTGTGIAQGIASGAAIKAMDIQPSAKDDITKTAVLSAAFMEGASIVGVVMAIMLFMENTLTSNPFFSDLAKIGIIAAICLPGLAVSIASCLPVKQTVNALARQPFFSHKITQLMILTLSIIQTPLILGFIIAMFIKNQAPVAATLSDSLRLIGSGLCIGIGSIGPAVGLAVFAATALQGLGVNRAASNKILPFTFISQAIIETPVIFSLVIALALLLSGTPPDIVKGVALLGAGLCMGLGTIAPGISSGRTAAAACKQIALNPANYDALSKTSIFAQGVIDTSAVYALLIAVVMIFMM
jgi:F0F1-type ATP synthase membrane subunit c/vacuolar-type H+-ATPase subunit K